MTDDEVVGTKPSRIQFEIGIDEPESGTLQCPEIGKVKIEVNDGAVEPTKPWVRMCDDDVF